MSRYGYLLAFLIPLLVVAGYYLGGWWNLMTLGCVFLIEPVLDFLLGVNKKNPGEEMANSEANNDFYKLLLYLWIPVQLYVLVWACNIVVIKPFNYLYEWAGFLFGISLVTGGIGITVAHELGHRRSRIDRFLSQLLLMTVGYMHFYIEHNQGHHRNVATPHDPATARKNESFYKFWFRTVYGSYLSAWKIENKRIKKKNKAVISMSNRMIWYQILPIVCLLMITFGFRFFTGVWDWHLPAFLVLQGVLAFTLLELINYVEHYGILRKEIAPGRFERVNPKHSWNAAFKLSNYFLFQLQRHPDHHYYANKPYQLLKNYDVSPQLPAGYPTMIIVALIPPLWFSIMNKKLKSWQKTIEQS